MTTTLSTHAKGLMGPLDAAPHTPAELAVLCPGYASRGLIGPGLDELRAAGLAAETKNGTWGLTFAGVDRRARDVMDDQCRGW